MASGENREAAVLDAPPRKKQGFLLGGGIVGLVAAAYIVAMVAVPSDTRAPHFDGPYIVPLSAGDIQVNLKDRGGKNYLVMSLSAEYFGYDEEYVTSRVSDPVYQARIVDALISLGRQRTMDDVTDSVGEEAFKEEILSVVTPLLFPVHVGNPLSLNEPHEESGLRAGTSIESATMRGGFGAHWIDVDASKRELRLDDGPARPYQGTETDLELVDQNGLTVHVDVTGLHPDWVGRVPVGTFGRVSRILNSKFLTQ